jgi:outer membrane murein-binding lipoprotein Lpp
VSHLPKLWSREEILVITQNPNNMKYWAFVINDCWENRETFAKALKVDKMSLFAAGDTVEAALDRLQHKIDKAESKAEKKAAKKAEKKANKKLEKQ